MIYADSHVHTRHSPDGKDSVCDIVAQAKAKGLSYLATTDHLDYDLKYGANRSPIVWEHIDLAAYYREWKEAESAADGLDFNFGIEAGFEDDDRVCAEYISTFDKYPFDVVINSVHFVDGMDVYFPMAFFFKSKKKMYKQYLEKVLKSLDAPYGYDIVAHIGYVTRNAPYCNKELRYEEFSKEIDAVLNGIIDRAKSLEVNTHHAMTPTRELLERYYALGGRKISYGSDSHRGEICKDYENTCRILKEIGFTHFSVFKKRVERQIPIG